jgi:hypothetical protein
MTKMECPIALAALPGVEWRDSGRLQNAMEAGVVASVGRLTINMALRRAVMLPCIL